MYALYKKCHAAFVVNWPRDKSAEDITRFLAHMKPRCPYEWGVETDHVCGEIRVTFDLGNGVMAYAQRGKGIEITHKGGWTNFYDAAQGVEFAYEPEDRRVGVVLDTDDLEDLKYLADRGHLVTVRPDGVIVDREHYSSYILRDSDGVISDLPYGDPHDYAIAEGLTCELLSESEWR